MNFFRKSGGDRGGPPDPPLWQEARTFALECRRAAHASATGDLIGRDATRDHHPDLSAADWFKKGLHHAIKTYLDEEGAVELDALSHDAKADVVGFVAPYILPSEKVRRVAERNPQKAERVLRDHERWLAALDKGPSRVRPGETSVAALQRTHKGPSLSEAYECGARDLRAGTWRSGETLWFLLPYAVARHRGVSPGKPPGFGALDAKARAGVTWMHRTMLIGGGSLHLMAEAAGREDPEAPVAGTGLLLAEWIYPFLMSASFLLVEWSVPDPLPMGARPKSRHCPWDGALGLYMAARQHAVRSAS